MPKNSFLIEDILESSKEFLNHQQPKHSSIAQDELFKGHKKRALNALNGQDNLNNSSINN